MKRKKDVGIDFDLPKRKLPKYLGTGVALVAIAGTFMFAGATLHSRMNPPQLPANQACLQSKEAVKEAARTFSVQLVAAIDGQDAPAPDLSAVKSHSIECKSTAGYVTVKQEASK